MHLFLQHQEKKKFGQSGQKQVPPVVSSILKPLGVRFVLSLLAIIDKKYVNILVLVNKC